MAMYAERIVTSRINHDFKTVHARKEIFFVFLGRWECEIKEGIRFLARAAAALTAAVSTASFLAEQKNDEGAREE